MLQAFGWSTVFPTMFDNLASLLVGHPFHGTKKTLWLAIIRTFFWTLWGKCNKRLFRDLISSFDRFLDFTLSTVLYWCKSKQLFNHLTLSYLVSN